MVKACYTQWNLHLQEPARPEP